jgi:DNA-binding CsgD family transcriptional regulator
VLRLLAAGRTDREIADALFVSRRTVNSHVANILGKLGVRSRREAAALVAHSPSPDPGPANQSG